MWNRLYNNEVWRNRSEWSSKEHKVRTVLNRRKTDQSRCSSGEWRWKKASKARPENSMCVCDGGVSAHLYQTLTVCRNLSVLAAQCWRRCSCALSTSWLIRILHTHTVNKAVVHSRLHYDAQPTIIRTRTMPYCCFHLIIMWIKDDILPHIVLSLGLTAFLFWMFGLVPQMRTCVTTGAGFLQLSGDLAS